MNGPKWKRVLFSKRHWYGVCVLGVLLLAVHSRHTSVQLLSRDAVHLNQTAWHQSEISSSNGNHDNTFSCPELIAASRFVLEQQRQGLTSPPLSMAMVQLVGKWTVPSSPYDVLGIANWATQRRSKTMHRVFEHNQQLCASLGITSFAIIEQPPELNITELDNRTNSNNRNGSSPLLPLLTNRTYYNESLCEMDKKLQQQKPNFWKIRAVYHTCRSGDYDVVWYLDGDILLTLPTFPIGALWMYHQQPAAPANNNTKSKSYNNPPPDILFAKDWHGPNSGIFLVNCRSDRALQFLIEWEERAVEIKRKFNYGWSDQGFIHYAFIRQQDHRRKKRKQLQQKGSNSQDQQQDDDEEEAIPSIRTTDLQCALTRYPKQVVKKEERDESEAFTLGVDVSVHTPSLQGRQFRYFRKLLRHPLLLLSLQSTETQLPNNSVMNQTEAAHLYILQQQENSRSRSN